MKFSAHALLLLGAAAVVSGERTKTLRNNKMFDRDLEEKEHRQLSGKKGDCTDGTNIIQSCGVEIDRPGRYVLAGHLNCGPLENGITITASDVHLDCEDQQIRSIKDSLVSGFYGIGVAGANHVSIANCKVEFFDDGLLVAPIDEFGTWSDLVVRGSTFRENFDNGMLIVGGVGTTSKFTISDTKSMENGDDGLENIGADGTIISSTFNKNTGAAAVGIYFDQGGTGTLIDVTTNQNGDGGILTSDFVTVINSEACDNDRDTPGFSLFEDIDISEGDIAQANTCDTSFPEFANILGDPICQCSCKGGPKSAALDAAADADATVDAAATTNTTIPEKKNGEKAPTFIPPMLSKKEPATP